jgi:hypothetical protein
LVFDPLLDFSWNTHDLAGDVLEAGPLDQPKQMSVLG